MQMVGRIRALAAALCVLLSAACQTGAPVDAATSISASPVAPSQYHLGPGDKLHIIVFDEDQLTADYLVGPQGTVAFPLIGDVPAQGMTTDQFSAGLAQRLEQGFVRQPKISIQVSQYRPFFILGEVRTPGTYPFSANLTVMSAVATAGGFTYRANTSRIYIKHDGDPTEHAYRLNAGTPVLPGDTVRVSERFF